MNRHTDKPACYLEGETTARAPAFRDEGRYCYTTPKEIEKLTPGCRGCKRIAPN